MFTSAKETYIMKKVTLVSTALFIAVTITGCAKTDLALEKNMGKMTEKVNALSAKVNSLSDEVLELKEKQKKNTAASQAAKESSAKAKKYAKSANERIDNLVSSYQK
jgi:murein lipoprotein